MKQIMGSIDRSLRFLIVIGIAILYFSNQMNGIAAIILGLFAIIFLITSFVGLCPLYLPLKLSTKRKNKGAV